MKNKFAVASAASVLALKPDAVILATGSRMLPPPWLPAEPRDAGLVCDLRRALAALLQHTTRQSGAAVIFDMDHSEATYAAGNAI